MPTATLSLKTATLLNEARLLAETHSPGRAIIICHPVWRLESGGLERQMLRIIGGLPHDRFHHLVVVRGPSEGLSPRRLPDNVELIRQDGPQRDLFWSRRLASILDDHQADLLHLRGLTMLTDGVLAAQFAGKVRAAMSFHGFESSPPRIGPVKRKVLRWAIGRCDARWAVSPGAAAALAAELNVEPDEFGILPNGVDTDYFVPAADRITARQRLGLPLDRPIVLTVGNLKPIKGHDVLLDAVEFIPNAAIVVFVGHDYRGGELQRRVASRRTGCDIRFAGRQADALPWYQAADLFVLPSLGEGMSNALLEAMACALPVVATDVGGNRDVVIPGQTGLLVPSNDPRSLADATAQLLDDPSLRTVLGQAARRHVSQFFTLSATRAEYERRYLALAGRAENLS